MADNGNTNAETLKGERSPRYPILGLAKAIARIQHFWDNDQGSAATKETLAEHWGFSPKSSGFLQTIATLRQFGLLDTTRDGRFRLAKLALDIVMLKDGNERRGNAIAKAAFKPTIFADLRREWPGRLPSDANMRHHLVSNRGFKVAAATALVKSFKNTVDLVASQDFNNEDDTNLNTSVESGDRVQWTPPSGVAQWPTPRTVLEIATKGDEQFVRVEAGDDDEGGYVPLSEVDKVETPTSSSNSITPMVPSRDGADSDSYDKFYPKDGIQVRFPFGNDNELTIRMRRPVSKKQFDTTVKAVFDLSQAAFVHMHEDLETPSIETMETDDTEE